MDRRVKRQIDIKTDEERKGKRERGRQIHKQIEKDFFLREKSTHTDRMRMREMQTQKE